MQNQYPPLLVFVSPKMKRNFAKHGDLLIFDIMQNQIRKGEEGKSFHVGIFGVINTSAKTLLAGIALFAG
jgi:hypothetical protein